VCLCCSDPKGWLKVGLHYTGSHLQHPSSMKVRTPNGCACEQYALLPRNPGRPCRHRVCIGPSCNLSDLHCCGLQHVPEAAGFDDTSDDSSDISSTGKGTGGCPLGLDTLRFNWFSPLGMSLARQGSGASRSCPALWSMTILLACSCPPAHGLLRRDTPPATAATESPPWSPHRPTSCCCFLSRPVQPKYGSVGLKVTAILLANLGGLCCVSLASAYYGVRTLPMMPSLQETASAQFTRTCCRQ
jgi:hypothetical protein